MRDLNGKKIPSKRVRNEKEVREFIAARALEIPVQYTEAKCGQPMYGFEILDMPELAKTLPENLRAEIEADPQKKWVVPMTLRIRVNHFKRMCKLARKKGDKAVLQYYHEAMALGIENLTPKSIGGINTEVKYGSAI